MGVARPNDRRVTISDLAERLGLSQSSVSCALNGAPGVSDATRARVRTLADELGWRPHAGARALRTRRAQAIGVVLERDPDQIAYEPFFYLVIAGIEQVLQRHDYSLLLRMVGSGAADLDVYRRWNEQHVVDGVILFDAEEGDARLRALADIALPMVLMGDFDGPPGVISLSSDGQAEAERLLQHLVDLGHRRVGLVSGPLKLMHEQARLRALQALAARNGVVLTTTPGDYSVASGRRGALELLAAQEPPTAILGSSDLTALGILEAAREAGLSVPGGLSVASWDDSLAVQVSTPALTALSRDPMSMGRLAAELLVAHLAGSDTRRRALPPPALMVRGSTGPITIS